MTRPEERRGQRGSREVRPEVASLSLQAQATAVVAHWEGSMGSIAGVYAMIVMTNDVKDQMRDDIVDLLNRQIALEHPI